MTLKGTEAQAKTRLLLTVWDAHDRQSEFKKSDLLKQLTRTKEKRSDYEPIYQALVQAKAIEDDNNLTLTAMGQQLLSEGLKSAEFKFDDRSTSTKTANPLLRWIRQNCLASAPVVNGNGKKSEIASYEDFKPVALEVFDRLNRDFNLDNLVPIYRIRREIGDRVERSNFDEWLLKLQSQDAIQLIGGEMPELTPEKAENSIKTALGSIRYYAKRL